jgi:glycosyltransferase involved in cell wall biosynthesis
LLDRFDLIGTRLCRVNPSIDTARFAPDKGRRDLREVWGLRESDVAVGMVARFQRYRKCDVLLQALKLALDQAPNLKVILIGRGGEMEETVHRPVRELGLANNVVTAGYLVDRYIDGLASLDAFAFLIAGSDGTGRALREAMAMGKPVLVNNIGMLPEMIEDGVSGLLFNDTPESLASQLVRVAQDAGLRQRLGQGAAGHARTNFSVTEQAAAVEAFYESLAGAADSENRRHSMPGKCMIKQPAES